MKHLVSVFLLTMIVFGADAASNGRATMSGKMVASAPRYTASVNQLNGNTGLDKINSTKPKTTTELQEEEKKDMREAERNACINNNIGIGNTFVWASRYSDTSNYANMVEDLEKPENNVCFVRVELKSDDESRVKVSDIAPKYFMWGEAIECGSWADAKEMEKRILDTRKGARIGGIVASTVGGAGVGVGAMELFGNRLIGGEVMGQRDKNITETELIKSNLLVLYNSKKAEDKQKYDEIARNLEIIESKHSNGADITDYETVYEPLIKLVKQNKQK